MKINESQTDKYDGQRKVPFLFYECSKSKLGSGFIDIIAWRSNLLKTHASKGD